MAENRDHCRSYYWRDPEGQRKRVRDYYQKNKEARQSYDKNYKAKHREKQVAYNKQWALDNPEKHAAIRARATLAARCRVRGITVEQYNQMLEAQGGGCKICESKTTGTKAGWHIDHDHATGKVRGLLCHHCNSALGHVGDNTIVLERMISYLKGE